MPNSANCPTGLGSGCDGLHTRLQQAEPAREEAAEAVARDDGGEQRLLVEEGQQRQHERYGHRAHRVRHAEEHEQHHRSAARPERHLPGQAAHDRAAQHERVEHPQQPLELNERQARASQRRARPAREQHNGDRALADQLRVRRQQQPLGQARHEGGHVAEQRVGEGPAGAEAEEHECGKRGVAHLHRLSSELETGCNC
eukprot:scaffold30968_cov66-Phaeocystis_antarctica.AAC.5